MWLKNAIKRLLPTSALQLARKRLKHLKGESPMTSGQQLPEYYDETFENDESWRLHYTLSPYYVIWTVILDRLRQKPVRSVLEIGCGSGQLACAIRDAGLAAHYHGFDFSPKRLGHAQLTCPEFRFDVADAFETELIESTMYDTVISTEFLEHVEGDLEVIGRVRAGSRVIATVPNYPYISHVRHFENADDVAVRYRPWFDALTVTTIFMNDRGRALFLIDGVRRP